MDAKVKIQKAIDFIEANLCEKISPGDLAKEFFFSQFHFHRLFHRVVGETIMEYVRKRRLAEAAIDLKKSKASITDIALKYQFSSEESFSRAFKRMYSISPRKHRSAKNQVLYFKRINVIDVHQKAGMNNQGTVCMAA